VKRTTRITVETRRVVVINGGQGSTMQWCAGCDRQARMLTPEDAAAVASVRIRLIYHWVETGLVHFTEARDGLLMICVNSLPINGSRESAELTPPIGTPFKMGTGSQS
jgi:hypothetical protein